MSALQDFFRRVDDVKPAGDELDPMRDEDLAKAAELMRTLNEQWAARAGVDPDDLSERMLERQIGVAAVIARRIIARVVETGTLDGERVTVEIVGGLRDAAAGGFLYGVLWEQDRQLPDDLRDLGTSDEGGTP